MIQKSTDFFGPQIRQYSLRSYTSALTRSQHGRQPTGFISRLRCFRVPHHVDSTKFLLTLSASETLMFGNCLTSEYSMTPTWPWGSMSPPSSSRVLPLCAESGASTSRVTDIGACLDCQQGGLLQFVSCRNVRAASWSVVVSSKCRRPPDVYGQKDRPHLSKAQRPPLVECPWACHVQVTCVGVPVSSRHGTAVPRRRPMPHVCWWQPPSPVYRLSNSGG